MKTINDNVFGVMTYNSQWERQIEIELWGQTLSLLLAVESETDDDEAISEVQCTAYAEFMKRTKTSEREILRRCVAYCQEELFVSDCNTKAFKGHNHASSVFFPLSGGWSLLFDSDYDEESGLAVVVRDGNIEVGPQDIIL